jgi:hypothetical protein
MVLQRPVETTWLSANFGENVPISQHKRVFYEQVTGVKGCSLFFPS